MTDSDVMEPSAPNSAETAHEHDASPPTYAPATMALGVMMLLWGLTTMWIMSVTGFGVIVWALWMWVNEMQLEAEEGSTCE